MQIRMESPVMSLDRISCLAPGSLNVSCEEWRQTVGSRVHLRPDFFLFYSSTKITRNLTGPDP